MTVSAGAGGGSVVGVVLGGGATGGGGAVVGQLPHTGAGQLMTMVAIALFLLVAGFFITGMANRRHELRPAQGGDSSSG